MTDEELAGSKTLAHKLTDRIELDRHVAMTVHALVAEVQRLQPFEGKARELRHQKDSGYDVMASSCVDDLCKLVDDD